MRKLQYFEIPGFLALVKKHHYHGDQGNSYGVYEAFCKLGFTEARDWMMEHIKHITVTMSREHFTHLIAEPWVDDVYQRVEAIRQAALTTAKP